MKPTPFEKCYTPGIERDHVYKGEQLEKQIERAEEGKEVISSVKDEYFTPSASTPYEYDIRGDKFDHAIEIAEKSQKTYEERMAKALEKKEINENGEPQEAKNE